MKKSRKFMAGFGGVLIVVLFLTVYAMADNPQSAFLQKWGQILKSASTSDSQDIYAEGKNTTVRNKDIEQAKQFFILSGAEEEQAEKQAVEYVMEREALYHAAIQNGYEVTEQEVWDYLEELKVTLNTADNKEDFQNILNQFDSEKEYWDFQFTVYEKNLPIQNYVKDLEKQYMETQTYSEDGEDAERGWEEYFEKFKDSLKNDENYQIVDS